MGRGFDVAIPPDAFVAMDYHLDWLYGALVSWASRARTRLYVILTDECDEERQRRLRARQERRSSDIEMLL